MSSRLGMSKIDDRRAVDLALGLHGLVGGHVLVDLGQQLVGLGLAAGHVGQHHRGVLGLAGQQQRPWPLRRTARRPDLPS